MVADGCRRITASLDEESYERLKYWADKYDMSVNEYMKEAIEFKIRWDNKDYDLPALEIQRLNQLIDIVKVLSENTQSLESVVIHGFDSLLGLVRGDNYLLDEEDGGI